MDDNVIQFRGRGTPPVEPPPPPPRVDLRQRILSMVTAAREEGVTWRDVQVGGGEHGSISAALSTMHKAELLTRLADEREGCKVYVLPELVGDRETERPSKSATISLLDDMAGMLREIPARCKHQFWHINCRSCEIRLLLDRYDSR